MSLSDRPWMPDVAQSRISDILARTKGVDDAGLALQIGALATRNRAIHEVECFNLNPATNVMNPAAEALLDAGLGSRPSLGHPGDKYEMGLEAIEEIEV
ncbi:MAG: serine hydroxymethyltransferase, partial [Halocynthiibacter sp.]